MKRRLTRSRRETPRRSESLPRSHVLLSLRSSQHLNNFHRALYLFLMSYPESRSYPKSSLLTT
jgi:hypothetical protein